MPDLEQVLKAHTHTRPEYTDHLSNWIHYAIRPFRVPRFTIFTEPDFMSGSVRVHLEASNLPQVFTMSFSTSDMLEDSAVISEKLARAYGEWFQTIYVLPEDNIELGEN